MADGLKITERDGWLCDERGNRNSISYYGSREAAEKALRSLIECSNCTNCTNCSDCSDCSDCSYCSRCSYCSHCSGCSDCSDCSRCSDCSDCSYCSGCSYCSDCSDCSDAEGGRGDKDGGRAEPLTIPKIENIHTAIYAAASQPQALEMNDWHTCSETHCRAGWAVTLAGEAGKLLEREFNTELAAMLIYRESGYRINPARFYDKNDEALADMQRLADAEGVPA